MAWSKIENALPKKNKSFLWLKIAASLLVISISTVLLWPNESAQLLVENTKPSEKTMHDKQGKKAETKQSVEKVVTEPLKKGEQIEKKSKAGDKPLEKSQQQKSPTPVINFSKQDPLLVVNEVNTSQQQTVALVEDHSILISPQPETASAQTTALLTEESTTLVLAANDVSKYLRKNTMADATTEEENTSSFRKLLDKASDLKNSDSGMSELRQKKNEILALNFRNDKRERNN